MRLNCGDTAPVSGNYKVVDENGRVVGHVSINKGETMPPTSCSDCHYELD